MDKITIHEVGMRDGLQIERQTVPTDQKILWIEQLISSGVDFIQIGSFVHPEKVPQMADTDRLFRHFARPRPRSRDVILSGLVLNERGLDRGLECGVELFCMGASASETHSRRNTGMGTDEAVSRICAMARRAVAEGMPVQVSVQSAFGCGFEGKIPEERVMNMVRTFLDAGLRSISLADTAGHAVPPQVEDMFGAVLALDSTVKCTCHFHDTYGMAMANACAALRSGVQCYEVGFAGIGGCPFTATTAGNLCSEDFIYFLQRTNRRQDIDLKPFMAVVSEAGRFFQRSLPGAVHRTGLLTQIQDGGKSAVI